LNQKGNLKYYPVSLDVAGRDCLVVGGGSVGARKALTLAKCRAQVSVVSLVFSEAFITHDHNTIHNNCYANHIINRRDAIQCIKKPYDVRDLDSMFLVIGATDNMELNRQIAQDAKERQILCNIADFPEGSSFVLPSIVQRGDLVITVSTSGQSPALAKKLRKELELQFGEEYAKLLMLMGNIRKRLLGQNHSPDAHASVFRELVNSDLLEKIGLGDCEGINKTLKDILGSNIPDPQIIFGEQHDT